MIYAIDKNFVEAEKWYKVALKQGYEEAEERLEKIKKQRIATLQTKKTKKKKHHKAKQYL